MSDYLTDLSWLKEAEVYDIFREVDAMLRAGKFAEVNQVLLALPIEEMDTDLVLAFLTITAPAHRYLPDRPNYFVRSKALFIERGEEDIDSLVAGLESP